MLTTTEPSLQLVFLLFNSLGFVVVDDGAGDGA